MATVRAIKVVTNDAVTSGRTPNSRWASANSTVHSVPVRKSQNDTAGSRKNSTVGPMIATTMPIVVSTDMNAARKRTASMRRSPLRGCDRRRETPAPAALVMVLTFRSAAEQLVELFLQLGLLLVVERDERGGFDDRVDVLDVESDELLDLRPLQRFSRRVDEQLPAQWCVRPVLDGVGARHHAPAAAVDLQRLERLLVLLEIGKAEVAQGARRTLDGLDDHVVVLGRLVVGARGALLTVHLAGEVVERAGVGAGSGQDQLLVGERRVDLVPVGHGRARRPDRVELLYGQAGGPVVVGVDHDRQRVVGDRELVERDAGFVAKGDLVVLDGTGGVGDVGLAVAELLEAAAGAGLADRDVHTRVLLHEELGRRAGQRKDGARTVDDDLAGQLFAAALVVRCGLRVVALATRGQHESGNARHRKGR